MKETQTEMNELSNEQRNSVRQYLLGSLGDLQEMNRIEEKIMFDEDFAEQLAMTEDELIEEYLDDALNESDRERFQRFFLASPENKESLRLVQNLRKLSGKHPDVNGIHQITEKKVFTIKWRQLFSFPAVRLVAVILLFGVAGLGIWRMVFYQSDADLGLAQLRLAYRSERPVEARITGFDYAPLSATRGMVEHQDNSARTRAEGFLLHAAADNQNVATFKALGKFYLTERKFAQANQQFAQAALLAPNDAQLQSDWGAALLEMGKKSVGENEDPKSSEYFDQSLKHLDKAISSAPKLLEPRFNRALCLQFLLVPEQARKAWGEYLELDADSLWATEARRNLQILESQKVKERSAEELEQNFLNAFMLKKNDEAWRLISRNRELIREKYLPQRLVMSFLEAKSKQDKETFLAALEYAGELEKNHTTDPFVSELSRFYKTLPAIKAELLRQAQSLIRKGYQLCLNLDYKSALNEFKTAQQIFSQTDDLWESKLSDYLIGYCLVNTDRVKEGLSKLDQIVEFSEQRNYKWLEVTSLYWLGGSFALLKQSTEAKRNYQKALTIAEETGDSFAVQRNLFELAMHASFVGQKRLAIGYLENGLIATNDPEISLRQRYRNYGDAVQILTRAELYSAAKPMALEAVWLADKLDDPMFKTLSRNNAAYVCVQTENFSEARIWLNDGRREAETISDERSRKRMTANYFLESGYLEKQAGDYEKSEQFYDEAVELYQSAEMPINLYTAEKGKLFALLALGKNSELERQIPIVLKLTEEYREKILEEQERTSFFDSADSVYDIAVDYYFGRSDYEQAYNYTEMSSSRSLLDWLAQGAKISGNAPKNEILLEKSTPPLDVSEIRQRMPEEVQILQYSVLDNKVLIWLISKKKFVVVPVKIESVELHQKVENYVKLLKEKNDASARISQQKLARELYELLISPILTELDPEQEICLIPSKILFYLPFAALVSPENKPLLSDFNILYTPSASVFLFCTEVARKKSSTENETLLSIGNPAFDKKEFEDLSDLPDAVGEARDITFFYENSQTFTGREATKTVFQNLIRKSDIIHFAGHYVVIPDAPLASYLLLAKNGVKPEDSILTNAELVGTQLPRAKLIVLSACQTGIESYYNGEGLIGLSRTFLAAGAPLVVASAWSVDSEATAELMKRFHFYRAQGKMTTTAALRSAQLEMLNAPDGRYREAYYWAAFAAFGGYTTF